jgi:hypothetical protein
MSPILPFDALWQSSRYVEKLDVCRNSLRLPFEMRSFDEHVWKNSSLLRF